DAPAAWAICTTPKPVSENNAVSTDCILTSQVGVPGNALIVDATLPQDACARFGPDPPPSPPGQPPLRPVDPDVTGGYYQPAPSLLQADPGHYIEGFGLPRITCNLADAAIDVATEFRDRYHTNQNPQIAQVAISLDGTTSVDVPASVHVGQVVTFLVGWP